MWNIARNFEFENNQNLIYTLGVAVDQDWRSKLHALKCASQPPDVSPLVFLSLPSQSGKGAL